MPLQLVHLRNWHSLALASKGGWTETASTCWHYVARLQALASVLVSLLRYKRNPDAYLLHWQSQSMDCQCAHCIDAHASCPENAPKSRTRLLNLLKGPFAAASLTLAFIDLRVQPKIVKVVHRKLLRPWLCKLQRYAISPDSEDF